ncbi:hypothetical protein VTI74DRAFT_5354 [Chaetomium olivicolor]
MHRPKLKFEGTENRRGDRVSTGFDVSAMGSSFQPGVSGKEAHLSHAGCHRADQRDRRGGRMVDGCCSRGLELAGLFEHRVSSSDYPCTPPTPRVRLWALLIGAGCLSRPSHCMCIVFGSALSASLSSAQSSCRVIPPHIHHASCPRLDDLGKINRLEHEPVNQSYTTFPIEEIAP